MPTLPEAVAALKAFVKTLEKRKDIRLLHKQLGRPARKQFIDGCRQRFQTKPIAADGKYDVPADLVELWALMDGAHIEWEFVDGTGGGCLRLPQWSGWTRFEPDEVYYNSFGPGKVSLLFDEIRAEGATWYVADGLGDQYNARLLFAQQGEGDAGRLVADSIAEYLTLGMAAGFAYYWPIETAESCDTIRRFQAPAVPPSRFSPGVRVHSGHYAEGCRGEVLKLHRAAPGSELANLGYGNSYALVQLDAGARLWMTTHILKVLPKKQPDYYEQVRADPWQLVRLGQAEGWHPALRHMGLLWGPIESYSGLSTSHSRAAAGLLSSLPLGGPTGAVALATALAEGAASVRTSPSPFREMPEAERPLAFSPRAWKQRQWQLYWLEQWAHDYWQKPLETLITGLVLLVVRAAPEALATVDPAHLTALQAALPFWLAERAVEAMRAALAGKAEQPYSGHSYPPTPDLPDQFRLVFGTGF